MLKQIILLILFSFLALLFLHPLAEGLHFLHVLYLNISHLLSLVFAGGLIGQIIRQIISLLTIAIGVSLIPACLYWLVKRGEMPYFYALIWLIWGLLIVTIALHR